MLKISNLHIQGSTSALKLERVSYVPLSISAHGVTIQKSRKATSEYISS
jgi:hypothetical protein